MSEPAPEQPPGIPAPKPAVPASADAAAAPSPDAPPLTPEEQMEKFARDLKENDWGHQPC